METFDDEAGLVALNVAVGIALLLVHPLDWDGLDAGRCRLQGPGVVGGEGCNLLIHGEAPLVGLGGLQGFLQAGGLSSGGGNVDDGGGAISDAVGVVLPQAGWTACSGALGASQCDGRGRWSFWLGWRSHGFIVVGVAEGNGLGQVGLGQVGLGQVGLGQDGAGLIEGDIAADDGCAVVK